MTICLVLLGKAEEEYGGFVGIMIQVFSLMATHSEVNIGDGNLIRGQILVQQVKKEIQAGSLYTKSRIRRFAIYQVGYTSRFTIYQVTYTQVRYIPSRVYTQFHARKRAYMSESLLLVRGS